MMQCTELSCMPRISQAAMNNMTNEIMLLGVATLILSAVERDVGKICSASLSAPANTPKP